MEHVYVQEPEKLQIAITHRLSATELNPDWTVLTSSSAPSTGSVQYNTASVGGSDVMVTETLPNGCGIAGATAADDGTCRTEDIFTLDQIIRTSEDARVFFYGNGDTTCYELSTVNGETDPKGREQGMRLRVALRYTNLVDELMPYFYSAESLSSSSSSRKVKYIYETTLTDYQHTVTEVQQISTTDRIRIEKWGVLIHFDGTGQIYDFSFSVLTLNLVAGLSLTFSVFKVFPSVWLFLYDHDCDNFDHAASPHEEASDSDTIARTSGGSLRALSGLAPRDTA